MDEPFAGGGPRIDQARRSIRNMIEGLPPGIDVGLIDFRGCDKVRRDRFYSDDERGQLMSEIDGLSPWGGRALARSDRKSLVERKKVSGRVDLSRTGRIQN